MSNLIEPKFDRDKFRDVVHFVCDSCDVHELGNVKLHKILYFSDMLCFLSRGKPLTGEQYYKQQFGPVARHLTSAVNSLCEYGLLRVEKRDYFGFPKLDYVSLAKPSLQRLNSNEEVQILRDVIDFVCARSAREISELSHNVAWDAAMMGELIPYFSAFGLLPSEISEEDMQSAVDEARRIRPVIDAQLSSS